VQRHKDERGHGATLSVGSQGKEFIMAKSSSGSDPEQPKEAEFTPRVIALILKSFHADTDPERLQWLAEYLPAWAKHDLPILFHLREYGLTGAPRHQVLNVVELAVKLQKELAALDPRARIAIIRTLPPRPTPYPPLWWATDEALSAGQLLFEQIVDCLDKLIRASDGVPKQEQRGRPIDLLPISILDHLASMFEYVTGLKARRQIDRAPGEYEPYETGPFYEFAAAVWPVIFGSGDLGLPSALKKWAAVFREAES
jgi:hypothetical protein